MPSRPHTSRPAAGARDGATAVGGHPARDGRGGVGAGAPRAAGEGSALPVRGRISVQGIVQRVTLAPALGLPSFAVLARVDWHGTWQDIRVIWMGQRRVPGIEAGIGLRFEGMVTRVDGSPTVYNPRYEIIGRPEEY